MRNIMWCRRTYLGTLAIVGLLALGFYKDVDVTIAIAGVVAAIAGSNAYEKRGAGDEQFKS